MMTVLDESDLFTAELAEALFTSPLSADAHPGRAEVESAIRDSVTSHGGVRACAGEMAEAYGEHPETAVRRMRWARDLVRETFPTPSSAWSGCVVVRAPAGVACTGPDGERSAQLR